jgi:AMP nucleosidase
MKTKQEIVENWLPRYTDRKLDEFDQYILLTNFTKYVEIFADNYNVPIKGLKSSMPNASANGITIINFGMGSANAATIMDLLSAIKPKGVLFLGKCGGLKANDNKVGDYIVPIAAIRGEGTSNEFLPQEVPALPAFSMLRALSSAIRDRGKDYWTGTVYTTNRRVWEYDTEFKAYLKRTHASGVDMETATLFIAGFANKIPTGALLMISDMPVTDEGIKTEESDNKVTKLFAPEHVMLGVEALRQIIENKKTIRHIRFNW